MRRIAIVIISAATIGISWWLVAYLCWYFYSFIEWNWTPLVEYIADIPNWSKTGRLFLFFYTSFLTVCCVLFTERVTYPFIRDKFVHIIRKFVNRIN